MLTEKQIGNLKKKLDDRLIDLHEEVRLELLNSGDQNYKELAGQVHDIGEASVADLLVDLQFAEIQRHVREIRDIEEAFSRISTGHYGVCTDCKSSIAVERLQSYPTAKRCYQCQVDHESTYAVGSGPSL